MFVRHPREAANLLLGVAALSCVLTIAEAQSPTKPAPSIEQSRKRAVDEKAIRALIAQLGDESFDKREAAYKRLAAIGEPALRLLQNAAMEATDLEIRTRAEGLLDLIAEQLFPVILTIKGHKGWANRVAVAPDGKHFVSAGTDGVRLWETSTGKKVLTYTAEDKRFFGLSISGDGSRVIAGDSNNIARVFEFSTGKEIQQFKGHQGPVWAVALVGNNQRAITGGWDQSLRMWDVATGKELGRFTGIADNVRCLALSPDGQTVAIGHFGEGNAPLGTLRLWDISSQKEVREYRGHTREVSCVSFSADGKLLLTSSFDRTVRVWDVGSGKERRRFKCTSRMECAAFVEGGRRVLCAGNEADPTLQLWDVESGTRILRSAPVEGGFLAVAPVPSDRKAITAGRDGQLRFMHWKR